LLSRRQALLGAAGAVFCASRSAGAGISGLRQIAASRGLLFGSMVRGDVLARDRAYADMMARECNLFVCREVHFDYLEPRPGSFEFGPVDTEQAWAAAHRMEFRGACLVWGEHAPRWFAELPGRDAARRALTEHIAKVCGHYAGRMQSWDVVNEGLKLEDGQPGGLRKTAFLDRIGPDYIDIAFRAARQADPKAQLVYNDFGVELDLSWHLDKRRALLALLDGLKKRGVPIDAVGLQSHLTTDRFDRFNDRSFASFLKELSDRGLAILISELDVYDDKAPADTRQRDKLIAGIYKRYLDVALANKAVKDVISWGLTDADNWVDSKSNPSRRQDGSPSRPLPFDRKYAPKPAYVAIAEALNAAPPR
jgi:endo-1,4-beta-xylanase